MDAMREDRNVELFKKEVKQIVSRITGIDQEELQERVLIRDELGIDSLRAMEIVGRCEKQLNLKIDEALLADIRTFGDFLDLLIGLAKSREKDDDGQH
jgi:acyl carrier protein